MSIVSVKVMKQSIMLPCWGREMHTYHQAESSDERKAGGQGCAGEDMFAVAQVTYEHERHEQEARVECIREGNRQPEPQLHLHLVYNISYLHFANSLSLSISLSLSLSLSDSSSLSISLSSYIELPLKSTVVHYWTKAMHWICGDKLDLESLLF
jgi:hypothetical protein